MNTPPEFDRYADSYDAALAEGLSVSGEDKHYFARGRVEWLKRCLRAEGARARTVMDYGCGTGTSVRLLLELPGAEHVCGVDVSPKSLERARETHVNTRASFYLIEDYQPTRAFDLVFSNGTFHHIAPEARAASVDYVRDSLHMGGLFALWENNPLNPATRYVMSRCPFDEDAIMLTAGEARALLRGRGFEIISTSYLFIFPRLLRHLRFIEPHVARLPLGTQYQILCRKV
ncbi:MAG TPA: methyltransferase domain-containing protein [Pyrinomonadaceae bacterium]|nr:methyltransferase domain-containing protein [Pyrinomonadaceae bacterium]